MYYCNSRNIRRKQKPQVVYSLFISGKRASQHWFLIGIRRFPWGSGEARSGNVTMGLRKLSRRRGWCHWELEWQLDVFIILEDADVAKTVEWAVVGG
jgi:hypothetical protein